MKNLLIPTDFSKTSIHALEFGLELAQKAGYHVKIFHGIDFPHSYESMYFGDANAVMDFSDKVEERAKDNLENLIRQYRTDGLSMEKIVEVGSLTYNIREVVEKHKIDLLVIGTTGATGLKEFLVGSNTEKVVRTVSCPVIAVPHKTQLKDIDSVMVPVDIDELRPSFLEEVSKLQQLLDCSVEFVWVKTPHDIENLDLLQDEMDNLLKEYGFKKAVFNIVKDIFPQDGILIYSRKSHAKMLVMATHARRGIAHFLEGSLTEDTLNHARIPVWSYRINKKEKPINLENYQGKQPAPQS